MFIPQNQLPDYNFTNVFLQLFHIFKRREKLFIYYDNNL